MNLRNLFESLPEGYTPQNGYADLHAMTSGMLGGVDGMFRNAGQHPAYQGYEAAIESARSIQEFLATGGQVSEVVDDAADLATSFQEAYSLVPRRYRNTEFGLLGAKGRSLAMPLAVWVDSLATR